MMFLLQGMHLGRVTLHVLYACMSNNVLLCFASG